MTLPRRRLAALVLLFASLGTACSSTSTTDVVAADTEAQTTTSTDSAATTAPAAAATAPDDTDSSSTAPATTTLASTPLDFAVLAGGPGRTAFDAIPCQLAGPAVAAFAEGRAMELQRVTGNNCHWAEGPVQTIDIHFREIADIDVDERRRLHGADDTVVDESGPGTLAASYLDRNGMTDRYFFVAENRAVFLVAETNPPVTPVELRSLADEIAGVIGSAVDEGQYWDAFGATAEDPLCSVWSADTLAQMFRAQTATPSSINGCEWWIEGADYEAHTVTLGIDLYDTIEIHTRNGGSSLAVGDNAAVLEQSGLHGTLRQIAFIVGDKAMTVTVDSATNAGLADVLAANVASRIG